jgi:hypothetical protein
MKGALKVGERADQSAGVKAVALAVVRVSCWAVQWVVELAGWTAVSLAELTAASTALGMAEVKAVSSAV